MKDQDQQLIEMLTQSAGLGNVEFCIDRLEQDQEHSLSDEIVKGLPAMLLLATLRKCKQVWSAKLPPDEDEDQE